MEYYLEFDVFLVAFQYYDRVMKKILLNKPSLKLRHNEILLGCLSLAYKFHQVEATSACPMYPGYFLKRGSGKKMAMIELELLRLLDYKLM